MIILLADNVKLRLKNGRTVAQAEQMNVLASR